MIKSSIIYIVIIVALALYLVFGHNGLLKYYELVRVQKGYEAQITELQDKIKTMEKQIELVERDRSYMEYLVRKELGLIKPGEDVYIIDNETVHRNRDNKSNQTAP